jgi:hypothetical protein
MDPEQQKLKCRYVFYPGLLGIIFFMQGYGKIFTMGIHKVYESFLKNSKIRFFQMADRFNRLLYLLC